MKKSKNTTKKNPNKTKKQASNEKINLDNEIVIGLTPLKEENKKEKIKNQKNINKKIPQKKTNKKQKRKKSLSLKILKWTSIFIILGIVVILFITSSIFNIKEIKVENNSKVSAEEVIDLSTLKLETNMFKYSSRAIKNNIKTNAYIENVKIKKRINGTITLDIVERKPTYMLKFGNSYVYINNQGYMLEITETPLELPIITGFETSAEEIKEGNRLVIKDLEKLEDIIKIMNSALEIPVGSLITGMDISDKTNYKLILESEGKIVEFGGITNINVKLLKIQEIIEKEKGIAGEIYFQDSERTVFKENV